MSGQTIQPNINGNLDLKYENIDGLDLIKSDSFTGNGCQGGCPNCIKSINYYLKKKIDDLKVHTIDYKPHFKRLCFNCSSSFHGSRFEDGFLNIEKMFEVEKECKRCQRNFTTERSFHHNCNICNESFTNCKLLIRHHKTEHKSKKPYQCAACYLSFTMTTVNQHVHRHTLPYICPYCNKRHSSTCNLKLHLMSHTGERPFSCKYCPRRFRTKFFLDIHLLVHTGGKEIKCDLCDKTFIGEYTFNQHKLAHIKKFHCKYCPKKYTKKNGLNIHLFEHTGVKKFKCDICDRIFAKRFLLNKHKSLHNMGKSFQCKYCPKQFKTKPSLYNHQTYVHTSDKKFKCDECDKRYVKRSSLNLHKATHIPEQLQCKYCPRKYKTTKSLDMHLFEHTGDKQFACDSCDKAFAQEIMLKRHKLTHVVKSIQCTICLKFYRTSSSLKYHIRSVHE